MNKIVLSRRTIFLLIIVFGMTTGALAQTETNVEALLEVARIKKIQAEKDKAEAIEWARKNDFPVIRDLPGGIRIELMRIDNGQPIFYITDNYGAAVTTDRGIVCIGGCNSEGEIKEVLLLTWHPDRKALEIQSWPDLPFSMSQMTAALMENIIYLAGGQADS